MAAPNREQFFTTKPADQVEYTTLEIYNANAGMLRFVTGQTFSKDFTLESEAPRNAGEVVTFDPYQFAAPEPEQGTDGEVSLDIQLGTVGVQAKQYMRDVSASWPPIIDIVWRKHLSGVTDPVFVLYFQAETVGLQNIDAAISARQVNQAARDVSRKYNDDFPGLQENI